MRIPDRLARKLPNAFANEPRITGQHTPRPSGKVGAESSGFPDTLPFPIDRSAGYSSSLMRSLACRPCKTRQRAGRASSARFRVRISRGGARCGLHRPCVAEIQDDPRLEVHDAPWETVGRAVARSGCLKYRTTSPFKIRDGVPEALDRAPAAPTWRPGRSSARVKRL
jgi:hypothetical protein